MIVDAKPKNAEAKNTETENGGASGPPPYEVAWQKSLNNLQQEVRTYTAAEQPGSSQVVDEEAQAQRVAAAMRTVGDSHTDPKVQSDWHRKARRFSRAGRSTRGGILRDVAHKVLTLISIPFMLAGTILVVAGGAVQTIGTALGGVGDAVLKGSKANQSSSSGSRSNPRSDRPVQ